MAPSPDILPLHPKGMVALESLLSYAFLNLLLIIFLLRGDFTTVLTCITDQGADTKNRKEHHQKKAQDIEYPISYIQSNRNLK